MKALTVQQPWADLIARGEKFVENRTRPCPRDLIGQRIAIHAGKGALYLSRRELRGFRTGVIVCTAKILLCEEVSHARLCLDRQELPGSFKAAGLSLEDLLTYVTHPYCEGRYGIWLIDVVPVRCPFQIDGQLGYWSLPKVIDLQASTIPAPPKRLF